MNRRRVLALLPAAGAALALPKVHAQTGSAGRSITVAQIMDTSPAQQDVSKDFVIGSRAAWQDLNARGGLRGRVHVQHFSIEVDGTPESVRNAIRTVRDNASCVVLSGTAGHPAAALVATAIRSERLGIAHAAPWLDVATADSDDETFPIFAPRQDQIAHALKSLSVMNVRELGVVYASDVEFAGYQAELNRIAGQLGLRLQIYKGAGDLSRLGQRLTPSTPAILLFVGGTPELVQFSQGLEKQARQRYVIALADVDLQTMVEMGAGKATPVIVTQPVPLVTATSLPIVRTYRNVLGRLFDEPPVSLSLAGFIAARYTAEVLSTLDPAALTRAGVLSAFQRHTSVDLGGFRVAWDGHRRVAASITQSMLTSDGRVIG